MNLHFQSPFPWLWAVVCFAVVLGVGLARRENLSPGRLYPSLTLRLLIVLLLLLALADPVRQYTRSGSRAVLFLLDQSESVSPSEQDRALQMMRALNTLREADDRLGLITFARKPVIAASLGKNFEAATPQPPVDPGATDIAGAIELGIRLFPTESDRSIVLFSDGNETVGNARTAADLAERQDIAIHTVPMEHAAQNRWNVDRLYAPSRVAQGERFRLRAILTNETEVPVQVRTTFRKDGTPVNEPVEITLQPGVTPLAMDYKLTDTGLHAFDLAASYADGTITHTSPAFVEATGMPSVLIVGPDADSRRFFGSVISRRAFTIEERATLPETIAALLPYDCIVLNDVGRDDLPDDRIRMLQTYVQDFGGGLVTIGGGAESSLEEFVKTPLEDLLPVELEQRHTADKNRRDFVLMLLMDRSGSMQGEKLEMAKASAINAIQELKPGDSIGLIAFDDEAHRVVDLSVLGDDRSEIIQKVRRLTPGGGTDARMALVDAYRIFSVKKINIRKHIILMTDGITTERQLLDITRRVAQEGITISTIAIGEDANVPVLDQMRRIGQGEFHLITNFSELPRIVLGDMGEQVKEADDIEERFTPEIFHDSPMISGIRQADIPSLKGYVASRLKIAAVKPLITNFKNTEDPILAHWYYGLGRSAVMLSGVNSVWSEQWLKWRNFGKLWEQIIRWTMRTRSEREYVFHIRHDGNRLRLRVEAAGSVGAPPGMLRGSLRLPDNRVITAPFRRTEGNEYEGAFAVTDSGTAHLALLEEGGGDRAMWFGRIYLPGVPSSNPSSGELDGRPPDYRLLQDIASSTSGRFEPQPGAILPPSQAEITMQSLRDPLIILAILLFLFDVGVRRVDIPFETLQRNGRILRAEALGLVRRRLPS